MNALVKGGFVVSKSDAGLFMKRTATCVVYLITYVDDMLIACAELSEVVAVKQYLGEVFEVTDLGEATISWAMLLREVQDQSECQTLSK